MLKLQAEIIDMLVFGGNYCCSCRVVQFTLAGMALFTSGLTQVYHYLLRTLFSALGCMHFIRITLQCHETVYDCRNTLHITSFYR